LTILTSNIEQFLLNVGPQTTAGPQILVSYTLLLCRYIFYQIFNRSTLWPL